MSWWMQKALEMLAAECSKIMIKAEQLTPLLLGINQCHGCSKICEPVVKQITGTREAQSLVLAFTC